MTKKELKFWAAIMALNIIVFLPWYLLSYTESDFFPLKGFVEGSIYDRFKTIFRRQNYDPFRSSLDLIIIFGFIYLLRFNLRIKFIVKVTLTYYLTVVVYQIYASFIYLIYQTPPIIYNDLPFIQNGLQIVINDFDWLSILGLIGFFLVVYAIARLFIYTARSVQTVKLNGYSKGILSILLLINLVGIGRYGDLEDPSLGVQFVGYSIWSNVNSSFVLKNKLDDFDYSRLAYYNPQYQFFLDKKKPNIIIIFIESYGRILFDEQELFPTYKKIMGDKLSTISQNGYQAVSALSTAPVTGGGSWLSYTSFSIGFNLNSKILFHNFLKNNKLEQYIHLYKWLSQQGYKNYRLNSLFTSNQSSVPWDLYTSFFAVDKWIRFEDLNYNGILYGFGPAPPDQYSLNYTLQLIRDKQKDPFSLFFISKNSHNPFLLPHNIMEDWRRWGEINGENQPSRFFQKPTLGNYEKAINYQLDYIFQIINNSSQNDLFIIIGDHQPPALATEGFETPVHIISKDSTFIKGFENYGLTSGLLPDKTKTPLKHEGLYTMLLRELKRNYSSDSISLPDYLPNGIIFGSDQDTK